MIWLAEVNPSMMTKLLFSPFDKLSLFQFISKQNDNEIHEFLQYCFCTEIIFHLNCLECVCDFLLAQAWSSCTYSMTKLNQPWFVFKATTTFALNPAVVPLKIDFELAKKVFVCTRLRLKAHRQGSGSEMKSQDEVK